MSRGLHTLEKKRTLLKKQKRPSHEHERVNFDPYGMPLRVVTHVPPSTCIYTR